MTRKIKLTEWGDALVHRVENLLGVDAINTMTFDQVINEVRNVYDIDDDRINELKINWWDIRL